MDYKKKYARQLELRKLFSEMLYQVNSNVNLEELLFRMQKGEPVTLAEIYEVSEGKFTINPNNIIEQELIKQRNKGSDEIVELADKINYLLREQREAFSRPKENNE